MFIAILRMKKHAHTHVIYIYTYATPPRVIHQFWGGEEGWTKWSVWRATVRSMATRVIYPFWAFLVVIIEVGPLPGLRRIPAD